MCALKGQTILDEVMIHLAEKIRLNMCRRTLLGAAGMSLGGWVFGQSKERFPSRPIHLIVPVPPGGPADLAARALAEGLRAKLGQPVLVENRPGAAGMVGSGQALRAAPDGYTLLVSLPSAQITAPLLTAKAPYDGARDFTAVGEVARFTGVLLVNSSAPVNDVKELVGYVKTRPGRWNFGSTGVGSNPHLVMELLKLRTGMHLVHIPYNGGAAMLQALLNDDVQVLFGEVVTAQPWIRSKRLKPLAVVSNHRSPLLPEVPTLAEAGIADAPADFWLGIAGPPRMPMDLVRLLNLAMAKAVEQPAMRQFFTQTASRPAVGSPEALALLWQSEQRRWAEVIRANQIRAD